MYANCICLKQNKLTNSKENIGSQQFKKFKMNVSIKMSECSKCEFCMQKIQN